MPANNETGERCDASPNGMLNSPSVTNDQSNWCAAFYEPNLAETEEREKTKLAFEEKRENGEAPKMPYVKNAELYNFIEVWTKDPGVHTFRVSGEVEISLEETYLPIHIQNLTYSCLLEVCDAIFENPNGDKIFTELPIYSLTDKSINEEIKKHQAEGGRSGSKYTTPTNEVNNRYDIIGLDDEKVSDVSERSRTSGM